MILPLQVSQHSSGKKCIIHDEGPLNEYVAKSKFKLESWEEMFKYSLNAQYGIQFDLKKFYHEIDIAENHENYFGFMYPMADGQSPTYFVWSVLPYGYTRAPFIARNLLKPLISKWRSLGINIVVFYDDGLAVSSDKRFLKKASLQIQCDLLKFGLLPGIEKCFWDPAQNLDWNGIQWNFKLHGISILERRIIKCVDQIDYLIDRWPKVTFRDVSRLLGKITSMQPVLELRGQLRTRYLQMVVNIRHFLDCSWDKMIICNGTTLFDKAVIELKFWKNNIVDLNFRPFKSPPPTAVGWVDASDFAAGGLACKIKQENVGMYRPLTADNLLMPISGATGLAALRDCASWQVDTVRQSLRTTTVRDGKDLDPELVDNVQFVHRMFTYSEMMTDSNEREMIAARELCIGSKAIIQNSVISLHTDNMNSAIILMKGSPKHRLHKYAIELDDLSLKWNFKIQPIGIPRDINYFCDKISKCLDLDDYSVTENFFTDVLRITKIDSNYDRFANNYNTKTALFNSASFCVGTSGVDCFCYDWGRGSVNWLFPPPRLIVKTVNHLQMSRGVGLLLAPEWKSADFYPYLTGIEIRQSVMNKYRFNGKNIFKTGSDKSSFFGPDFNCAVNVWHLDFSN